MSKAVWSLASARPVADTRPATPDRVEDDRGTAPAATTVRPRASAEARPLGARFGAVLGVVLTAAVVAEVYVGVVVVGFDDTRPLLALALALDAGARALGTIAAGHAGLRPWAWRCAVGGSPLVALFASFVRQESIAADPAPLARVISLLAMGVAALGALVAVASA